MPKTAAGLPPEKKSKSANCSSPSGKEKVALMTQEEMHGKIKIIPPKPKRKCSVFVLTYPFRYVCFHCALYQRRVCLAYWSNVFCPIPLLAAMNIRSLWGVCVRSFNARWCDLVISTAVEVFESSGFMDALAVVKVPKKRKKSSATPLVVKAGGSVTSPTATSPPSASSPTSPPANLPSVSHNHLYLEVQSFGQMRITVCMVFVICCNILSCVPYLWSSYCTCLLTILTYKPISTKQNLG